MIIIILSFMVYRWKTVDLYLKFPAFIIHELSHIFWMTVFRCPYKIDTLEITPHKLHMHFDFEASTSVQALVVLIAPLITYLIIVLVLAFTYNVEWLLLYIAMGRDIIFPSNLDISEFERIWWETFKK